MLLELCMTWAYLDRRQAIITDLGVSLVQIAEEKV